MSLLAIAADAATEVDGAAPFPPFQTWHYPSQIFWLIVFFGGLYLILSRLILPRLGATIERRGDVIASSLDEAERLNDRAQEAEQELKVRLAKAQSKARETADAAQAEVSARIAGETNRVDAKIDEQLAAAEKRISEMRAAAMGEVENVAAEAVRSITARFGVDTDEAAARAAASAAIAEQGRR
ncbi:MAG: hypothetical protein AAFX03_04440 [Pseudomonadota bacterium]